MLVILRGQRVKELGMTGSLLEVQAFRFPPNELKSAAATMANILLILRQLPREYNLLGCSNCGKYYIFTLK